MADMETHSGPLMKHTPFCYICLVRTFMIRWMTVAKDHKQSQLHCLLHIQNCWKRKNKTKKQQCDFTVKAPELEKEGRRPCFDMKQKAMTQTSWGLDTNCLVQVEAVCPQQHVLSNMCIVETVCCEVTPW